MSIFYADKRLLELEQKHEWDKALEYLDSLYKKSPSVNILYTIIGCAWYYFTEGPVEDGSYKLDSSKIGLEMWKKYVDIGLSLYSMNPYFSFVGGYTLSLHGFFLDAEFKESYEEKGLPLIRKCVELSNGLSIHKIAENFVKNEKSKKHILLQNRIELCKELFGGELLIDKYFYNIYSQN